MLQYLGCGGGNNGRGGGAIQRAQHQRLESGAVTAAGIHYPGPQLVICTLRTASTLLAVVQVMQSKAAQAWCHLLPPDTDPLLGLLCCYFYHRILKYELGKALKHHLVQPL